MPAISVDLTDEDRLAHVLKASEQLVGARSLEEVVPVLRDTARAAIGAEGVAVVIKDGRYCSYVAEDSISPLWQGQSFPADHCISEWVIPPSGVTCSFQRVRSSINFRSSS